MRNLGTRLGWWQEDSLKSPELTLMKYSHQFLGTSIRILLAMTAHLNLNLEQMDVTTAFLHGELEENILME